MQVTIAQQLGLDPATVANFFMNARRRGAERWKDSSEQPNGPAAKSHRGAANAGNAAALMDNVSCNGGLYSEPASL